MVGMMIAKETSHWWWIESHKRSTLSPWLQSTLTDLDMKTKAMLKLIEEDADSFAQRAEMYYKKRPDLISMVEDFYRSQRSLAERYDQLKSDGARLQTMYLPPISLPKSQSGYLKTMTKPKYSSFSDNDTDMSADSEVDDPEHVEVSIMTESNQQEAEYQVFEEVAKLREEIEKLKEESILQQKQLSEKDEEKREVIRQLSVAVEMLKEDNKNMNLNLKLKKNCTVARKRGFIGKLLGAFSTRQATVRPILH